MNLPENPTASLLASALEHLGPVLLPSALDVPIESPKPNRRHETEDREFMDPERQQDHQPSKFSLVAQRTDRNSLACHIVFQLPLVLPP